MPPPTSRQEVELLRSAKLYQQYEEEKVVSQFNCIGREPVTREESSAVVFEREKKKALAELWLRTQDRERLTSSKQDTPVVVPRDLHPYAMKYCYPTGSSASATTTTTTTTATTTTGTGAGVGAGAAHSAVEQVAARQKLLETFTQLARNCLLTQRVHRRVAKALMFVKGEKEQSSQLDSKNFPRLSFVDFPVIAPSSANALAMALPSSSSSSSSSNTASTGSGSTKGGAASATSNEDPANAASASKVEQFYEVTPKIPFHFKEMGYTPVLFPAHTFMNVDKKYPPEILPFAHEAPTEENLQVIPKSFKLEQFECQKYSLNPVFPMQTFSYFPNSSLELFPNHLPVQQETSAGITPPYYAYSFGQELRLPKATYPRNQNSAMLQAALPPILAKGRKEDDLSDSDNEEGEPAKLEVKHPTSLKDALEAFGDLPSLKLVFKPLRSASDKLEFLVPEKPVWSYEKEITNPILDLTTVSTLSTSVAECLTPRRRKAF